MTAVLYRSRTVEGHFINNIGMQRLQTKADTLPANTAASYRLRGSYTILATWLFLLEFAEIVVLPIIVFITVQC